MVCSEMRNQYRSSSYLVKNAGGVAETETRCRSTAPRGRLEVVLGDELAEVEQYLPVLLPKAQLVLEEAAAAARHHVGALRGAERQVEVVGEGEQEGLGGQVAECALQVKVVGGAPAYVGAVVGDVGQEVAPVGRAAQGLLVKVQDGDVAAVAGQRVEHAGAHWRRDSARTDDKMRTWPKLPWFSSISFIH